MIAATLKEKEDMNRPDNGCFTIMYHDETNNVTDILSIKWYASIYETPDGYIIRYPDRGQTPSHIKEVIITNIKEARIEDDILYIPNDIESLNFCIKKWCSRYETNVDYFQKERE